MAESKLRQAAKFQSTKIIKAWCLIVEQMASPMPKYLIERTLTGGSTNLSKNDFRQWDRWKAGQLPLTNEFKSLNHTASGLNWMPSDIGDLLLKIYCDRNGTVLENGVVDNVDQTVTLLKCMEFAKLHNNEELIDHCDEWYLTVFGPSEDDSAAINEWLQESNTLGDIINQGAINETIDVYLWQAIRAAYYCGADDPFEFIKLRLKETKNHWNVVKALYDDEIKLHGRSL